MGWRRLIHALSEHRALAAGGREGGVVRERERERGERRGRGGERGGERKRGRGGEVEE